MTKLVVKSNNKLYPSTAACRTVETTELVQNWKVW